MSDVTPEPTATRPRAGDRMIQRIQDELSSHKQFTKDELATMKRELQDAIASNKRDDDGWRKQMEDLLKDVNLFITEERESRSQRDKVSDNNSTIVVPPGDVRPVTPEPEGAPTVPGEEQRKRSWKDYF